MILLQKIRYFAHVFNFTTIWYQQKFTSILSKILKVTTCFFLKEKFDGHVSFYGVTDTLFWISSDVFSRFQSQSG